MSEADGPRRPPYCLDCEYFFVTWDPKFPRGCRVFDVKTRRLPSQEVFSATGRHCPSFQRRRERREQG